MKHHLPIAITFLVSFVVTFNAQAQTCSCAAVPLLGSMQPSSPNGGEWFLGTTYEYHDVSDLIAGSSSVPDTTGRDRTSSALVVEASRGITEKWSISFLASAVEHTREVGGSGVSATGLGDGIVMAKYSPRRISLYSDSALSLGVGARVPIGEDDTSLQGIALAEDMQPSTGAYGSIAWIYWARAMNDSGSAKIYATGNYTNNSDNDRHYQFGHETVATFGGSYQAQSRWGFNLELSYRNAQRDERSSVEIPNTGGNWLDLNAGVQYRLTDALGISAGAKLPIRRDLNDELQFTTKYTFRTSVSYVFGNRD